MTRIAFLVQLPRRISPAQRFRVEQFESILKEKGYRFETFPFIDYNTYKVLYKKGFLFKKVYGVLRGFVKRIRFLFSAYKYDYIFLQREASPLGPPVFEWLLAKVLKRKIILDFDDAIWISDPSMENSFVSRIKCYWKIKWICKWSYKIAVGNDYLAAYARLYNNNVIVIPTCVDTKDKFNRLKEQKTKDIVIGWTGSHSTLKYLEPIVPVMKALEQHYSFCFLVICSQPPDFELSSMRFLPWREDTEIDDLLNINIGIMPLIEDAWSEGKCGFKLIQYMSLGIPAVASPVGINKEIICNNKDGFLCTQQSEWIDALKQLMENEQLRIDFGIEGRKKIVQLYSVHENAGAFLSLFT